MNALGLDVLTPELDVDHDEHISSSDRVFRRILRGLYEGHYVPGQRLVEADLVRQFNVSRGSIRETFSRLAAVGIVTLNLHRGASIRWLKRSEIKHTWEILEVLTGLAARLAAEKVEQGGSRSSFVLSYKNLMSQQGERDFRTVDRARSEFYRTMLEIADNRDLATMLASIHVHLVRIQFAESPAAGKEVRFEDYKLIADAILAGNGPAAERAARSHVKRRAKTAYDLPDAAFSPEN